MSESKDTIELKVLRDELRSEMLKHYQKDKGYDIWLLKVEGLDGSLLLDFMSKYYPHTFPVLMKGNDDQVWVYGLDENSQRKIINLNVTDERRIYYNKQLFEPFCSEEFFACVLDATQVPSTVYEDIAKNGGLVPEVHFEHYPEALSSSSEETKKAKDRMQAFIEDDKKLEQLIQEFLDISQVFTQKDLESLGSSHETENAKRYKKFYADLEQNGFYGTLGRKLNFWSGWHSLEMASSRPDEICSFKVPASQVMFQLFDVLENNKIKVSLACNMGLAKLYALGARGDVNVYIASGKPTEISGVKIGNYFWEAELPLLQHKRKTGEVDSIRIHLAYRDQEDHLQWEPWKNFDDKDIPIFRRKAYQVDIEQFKKDLTKNGNRAPEEVERLVRMMQSMLETGDKAAAFESGEGASSEENLSTAPPRKPIKTGDLREMLQYWRKQAETRRLKREQKEKGEQELGKGVDLKKETPLMTAVKNGEKEVALALIEGGANLDEVDNEGKTARMYAVEYGNDAIISAIDNRLKTIEAVTYHFQDKNGTQARARVQKYLQQLSGSSRPKEEPKDPPKSTPNL
jgi:Ankyrin repeats (3 copies)